MKSYRKSIKQRIASVFALCVLLASVFLSPFTAYAEEIVVTNQDDVFGKLESAARINVVMNNLKKCLNTGSYYNYTSGSSALSGSSLAKGSIFRKRDPIIVAELDNKDHSTSLWLEDMMGANNNGSDGALWCWQGQDDGNGLMQIYQEMTGQSIADIVCDAGKGRIFQRAKMNVVQNVGYGAANIFYTFADDTNCSSMNDSGAMYLLKDDWETGLKASYDAFRKSSDNEYLPTYDEIGLFNNIDGYFNYLLDYNYMCSADVYDTPPPSTTNTALTTYERTDTKIVAKTKYYHVTQNKSWDYSLSADNPVTSCQGLLDRMHELESNYNGVYDNSSNIATDDDRKSGYEGIILAKLKKACDEMKDEEGNPAYDSAYAKLQEIVADTEASEEEKQKAQESIDKIDAAKTKGTYVEIIGNKTDAEGQTFQCLDIEQMNVIVDEYEDPLRDQSASGDKPTCYDGGGSLGWILCPLLESMGEVTTFLYKEVIEPFLQVNLELFNGSTSDNSGSIGAWGIFRNIANIILIIFFIIVITSQISGIGIDNYGIKKLLPKIIVAAALINLSLIICQIAVDLSNILGYGLKSMFDQMANGISMPKGEYTKGYDPGGNIISTLVPILTIGIAGLAIWSQGLVAAILAVLATVLIAVIGIIFIFALLSIRQAGVVLLVVISPVAMACYMLPNTKSLFDKWYKAFQGLLLLYPICGLLIGAGNFASKILLSTDSNSFFIALSAMLINIVPFFFIPTLLKGCFAAMGNIGARISGVGKRVGGWSQRQIRDSDYARQKRGEHADYKRMRRAGVKYDKDGNLVLTKRGERQNAKAERTGWRGMGANAKARLNAERASFSRNAVASNNYLGEDAEHQFELDRMAQAQRDNRAVVEDTILAMQSGSVTYGNGKKVDVHDGESMKEALAYYILHGKGNEHNIQALTRLNSQQGDNGRKVVREGMEKAIEESKKAGTQLDASGVRAYSTEIMDNFAKDYKENSRSTFDFAQEQQSYSGGALEMPTKIKTDSLKAATIGSIDDGEFTRIEDTFNNAGTGADDKAAIARVAYDALNSESGSNIKEGRRKQLQELANHHIVKTMDCAALGSDGKPLPGSHERISLRGDGKYINEHGAIVKISSYKVIE